MKKLHFHVLTDSEGVGFCVAEDLQRLGRKAVVSHSTDDFIEAISGEEINYYLITDYLLGSESSQSLLLGLLDTPWAPSAVVVMSGYPGFEKQFSEIVRAYQENERLLAFIAKPFSRLRLEELTRYLDEVTAGTNAKAFRSVLFTASLQAKEELEQYRDYLSVCPTLMST